VAHVHLHPYHSLLIITTNEFVIIIDDIEIQLHISCNMHWYKFIIQSQ